MLIIKKKLKKINRRVYFSPLKIVFFPGFENDDIADLKLKIRTEMGLHTHPTTNFFKTSRPSRRLRFEM